VIEISLVKPILNDIDTFSATSDFQIDFVVSSGDQVFANECEILKVTDNSVAYSNKTSTPYFSLNHVIPANTLLNGNIAYKVRIRTYNSLNEYSVWSEFVIFNCYSNQFTDISNITDLSTITAQSIIPQGEYSQTEGDTLQSYKYILYDFNNIKLTESGLLYDGLLQYSFDGLSNNTTYKIELQTTTQHNVTVSITKTFTIQYKEPKFSSFIDVVSNSEKACMDVNLNIIRILGQTTGTVTIEDNDWANCLNGTVYFNSDNGFTLPSGDWTVQLWLKGLVDSKTVVNSTYQGTLITKLYGQNNVTFEIQYYDGCFHLYKYISNILFSHYVSNVISASVDNPVYLFCQSINGRINLQGEIPGASGYGVTGYGTSGYGM